MKHRNKQRDIRGNNKCEGKIKNIYITGISQNPHQKKVFKENRSKSKVEGKQVLDRGL